MLTFSSKNLFRKAESKKKEKEQLVYLDEWKRIQLFLRFPQLETNKKKREMTI